MRDKESRGTQASAAAGSAPVGESVFSDKLIAYLARFPLEQLAPRGVTGTIKVWAPNNVLCVDINERITRVFYKLVTEGFLSSPVMDRTQFMGFVDLMDLLHFTLDLFDEAKVQPTEEALDIFFKQTEKFVDAHVSDVLKKDAASFHPVQAGYSMLQAMTLMAQTGIHRIPVVDENHTIIGICTQSMIISILSQAINLFGDSRDLPMSALHESLSDNVYSVQEDTKVLDAFKLMREKNVLGLAVVNNDGSLIDNLSIRDLRGIGTNASRWKRLFDSVGTYKAQLRQEFSQQTPAKPITCKSSDTIATVLSLMDDGNIHRVFEVEEQNGKLIPKHVISQIDLIRFIVNKSGLPVGRTGSMSSSSSASSSSSSPM